MAFIISALAIGHAIKATDTYSRNKDYNRNHEIAAAQAERERAREDAIAEQIRAEMNLEEKGKNLFAQAYTTTTTTTTTSEDNPPPSSRKTIRLKAQLNHLVNEEDDSFSSHSIISIRKGEEVTLVDGDLSNGLKPPYQDYVLVERDDYEIGRVSKFIFVEL